MGLRQLRYFLAVAELESFRRASEKLHIAQPALSRQIALLESDLGVALFLRANRRTMLTKAGKAYLLDVRNILVQLDDASNRARRIATGTLGVARLAFHEIAGRSPLVLQTLNLFRTNYPEIELSLVQMTSHQQIDAFREGVLDGGFFYPSSVDPSGLEMKKISTDQFFLAVSKGHPLAARKRLKVAEITSERFVRVARAKSPRFYDLLSFALARRGVALDVLQEADSDNMLMNFVAIGMACAIVMSSVPKSWHSDVNLVPITDLDVTLDLYFAWDPLRESAPLSRFVECLSAQAKEIS